MPLETLWQRYAAGGYAAVREATPSGAGECLYLALIAFAEGEPDRAARWATLAAERRPESRVYAQAMAYLARVVGAGATRVYDDRTAFAAFIRGGGNVGLYAAASAALRAIYAQYESLRLLDIGVGDGLALLPALTPAVTRLDLVEPSAALLAAARAALEARGIVHRAHGLTLADFMISAEGQRGLWDVIQATWSLQSIPPDERPAAFRWLRAHGARVVIAEFDAPQFAAPLSPERVRYFVARYERGLAEYDGDGGLVAQGFLLPVFFGAFDRAAARTNWEGPIQGWTDDLRAAGFTQVTARTLYPYFWADAVLLDAR
ncbi:MAG: class I SAM-dependent methyltransferase [Anaerolineae bacterium]|nr:class I SAM-dependent methyltransferase [Anaerolineae bacterium]